MLIDPGGAADSVPDINRAVHNIQAGKGTIADQATVMQGSANNLVAAAGKGFKLHPEAATALIASCQESLDILIGITENLKYLHEVAPKLGGINGAQKVSTFTHGVAADGQGIVKAVRSLQGTIAQMQQAYQKAVHNYHAIEEHVAGSVKKLDTDVKKLNAPIPRHGRIQAV